MPTIRQSLVASLTRLYPLYNGETIFDFFPPHNLYIEQLLDITSN